MVVALSIVNTLVPLLYIIKKSVKKNKIYIDHTLLFSVGFWYYWIFPIIMGETHLLTNNSVTDVWYAIYTNISKAKLVAYLLSTLAIFGTFMFANAIQIHVKDRYIDYCYSKKSNNIWIGSLFVLFFYLVYKNQSVLFRGYTVTFDSAKSAGQFSAVLLMMYSLYVLYSMKNTSGIFKKDFINSKLIYVLLCAIVVLGMGGRLYLVTCVVSILVIYSCFYGKIPIKKFAIALVAALFLIGTYGIIRLGRTPTFSEAVQMIFLESGYTAFPLLNFLDKYDLIWLKFPKPLLSSFVNLIPTLVLPNKGDYIVGISDIGYDVYNPAGALNSFMSFQVNFGIVGTMVFVFVLTYLLKRLKTNKDNELSKLMYANICGCITFTFWRDSFSVSLVKCIFEFSILIPFIVAVSNTFITSGKLYIKKKG